MPTEADIDAYLQTHIVLVDIAPDVWLDMERRGLDPKREEVRRILTASDLSAGDAS